LAWWTFWQQRWSAVWQDRLALHGDGGLAVTFLGSKPGAPVPVYFVEC